MGERCPVHGRPLVDTAHAHGAVCPMCRAERRRAAENDSQAQGETDA